MSSKYELANHPNVMIGSTYSDMTEHRRIAIEALLRLGFFPIGMEFDSAKDDKDIIKSSYEMLVSAEAFIGIVSYRYGGIPQDPTQNPEKLSISELEYRWAIEKKIPVYMFLMSKDHAVKYQDVEKSELCREQLESFKKTIRVRSICAEFSSAEELKGLILQSMSDLKYRLVISNSAKPPEKEERIERHEPEIPQPPEMLAIPYFIPGHTFVGRQTELGWIDEWVQNDQPIMLIEDIGGSGKSMIAWHWMNQYCHAARPDLAGIFWYSFYEGGADMAAFAAYACAYVFENSLDQYRGRKTTAIIPALMAELRKRPFLFVLDGIERVLTAYHRIDASQTRDDEISSNLDHRACIRNEDEELLRQFLTVYPSKILLTTRLLPKALTNISGQPFPYVRHVKLGGFHPDDALTMIRSLGIRGNELSIRHYLNENLGYHPLLMGIVAGLVNDFVKDPGNFDSWLEDSLGGTELDLLNLDLSQRRTHILATALDGLKKNARNTISYIAAMPSAVSFDTLAAINSLLSTFNEKSAKSNDLNKVADWKLDTDMDPQSRDQNLPQLVSSLQDLEKRGLVQWDRKNNTYDLHPVVRAYVFDMLNEDERILICDQLVDYFQSRPQDRYDKAESLADVQQSINIFRALVQAKKYKEAANFYMGDFSKALIISIEAYHIVLSMLRPFFSKGFKLASGVRLSNYTQGYLINDISIGFENIERIPEAQKGYKVALSLFLEEHDAPEVFSQIGNLSVSYLENEKISLGSRGYKLGLQLAKEIGDEESIAVSHLDLAYAYLETGRLEKAWQSYNAFKRYKEPTNWAIYSSGEGEYLRCRILFHEGKLSHEVLNDAIAAFKLSKSTKGRDIRNQHMLSAQLDLFGGNTKSAIDHFNKVIDMTREIGLPLFEIEAALALAKAKGKQDREAREIADRLEIIPKPPHVYLSEIYLALKDQDKAKKHALKGYHRAWCDGLPYVYWWDLVRCRSVLRILNEPEPDLPSYAKEKIELFPYEREIRELIKKVNR